MTTKLSVNLNKVALLRNQRDLSYPSVTGMAELVIGAGADGITVHPRPDERHIRESDVHDLGKLLRAKHAEIELNIEGYPSADWLDLVHEIRPAQATLVPDSPEQRTSDHGWDLETDGNLLVPIIRDLREAGIRVSLFLDPGPDAIPAVKTTGADRIELYTEPYARAYAAGDYARVLGAYAATASAAAGAGLGVNAGHDLNLNNLPHFRRAIPMLAEVSIGHAITADALAMGFPAAVRAYLAAIA
ncbi:MAG TPA: pyridoxine 5'-phosphate synthase [Gammaproteobacteria bacterium]|nr:pyridoxine 5'-phosphate synthase [Gammaproteobacteria bacterium]